MVAGHLNEKNGYYHIVLTYNDEGGKRKYKWISTGLPLKDNKRKAEAMLVQEREKFIPPTKENIISQKEKTTDIMFSDFMLEWLEIIKGSIEITSYAGYALSIKNRICPYFKEQRILLTELTPKHIQQFYTYAMKEYQIGANTVIHYHANIRKALQYAMKLGMINFNPADRVERPKHIPYIGEYYNANEVKKLFNAVKDSKIAFAVFMAVFYGLRRSEIVGLKWSAIDFENKTMTIKHTVLRIYIDGKEEVIEKNRTKTKSSYRVFPLLEDVELILLDIKKQQERHKKFMGRSYCKEYLDYICVDETGKLLNPDYISNHFQIILRKTNMKKIRFHDLRHSCASLLLANGISMKEIQEWLGHSNFSTTANIYAHLDFGNKINVAETMRNTISTI